jgi:hypothetical protein
MAPPRSDNCQTPLRGARLERCIRRLIGPGGEKAIELLWRMAQGYPMPVGGVELPPGAIDLERVPSLELQRRCLVWLAERAFGKAPERVEVLEPVRPTHDLSRLSDTQLEKLREAVVMLRVARDDDSAPDEH